MWFTYPFHLALELPWLSKEVWLAGKVHGSLARAGKVRGQTPKVAKQEKKKNPKGRAMKRIKYNRRFVNVGEWLRNAINIVTEVFNTHALVSRFWTSSSSWVSHSCTQ